MKARLVVIFILSVFSVSAQTSATQQEIIAAHLNTTFFLAGETLHFQLYCLDKKSRHPSSLSKIGYVELVGSDNKPLVRIKVELDNGVGSGDFFFHDNIPSGNYTFIAHTRWMRNFEEESLFRAPLTVINAQLRPSTDGHAPREKTSSESSQFRIKREPFMGINKREFTPRELVDIEFENRDSAALTLSVSVRAADPELPMLDPWTGVLQTESSTSLRYKQINFLPDFRSQLVSGVIRHKADGKPLAGKLVTLSSPSKGYRFVVSTTDRNGRYYFNLRQADATLLLLGIEGYRPEDLTIEHEDGFLIDHSTFTPRPFQIDTAFRPLIARRYLPMQIENAFYSVKKDSIVAPAASEKFFTYAEKRYQLDDFTRFSSMDDVFREIIPEVVVKSRDGNYSLILMNSATGFRFENQPLMLVDGIPVYDSNTIMQYDPSLIKAIDLVTQRYYYGGLQANGIISIETYDGDAKNLPVENFFRLSHVNTQPSRVYFSPQYHRDHSLDRIPDFRTQLYWKAPVKVEGRTSQKLSFFTGDLTGKHIVEVMGVSSSGELFWWRDEFEVTK